MKTTGIIRIAYGALVSALTFGITGLASAHVTVKPAEVLTAGFQTFTVSVPNEKEVANTSVMVKIPAGLKHVTPSMKQGWNVSTEKTGDGEDAVVNAITWSGGSITAGLRDDFTFSAQVPADAGELQWKAYQTYADGVTVSWDKSSEEQPKKADGSPDFSTSGPFSITKVVAETAATTATNTSQQAATEAKKSAARAQNLAIAAIAMSVIAFAVATKSKRAK